MIIQLSPMENYLFIMMKVNEMTDPCFEVGLSPDFMDYYQSLNEDHRFKKWLDNMFDLLLADRECGNKIQKDRIPDYYTRKYGVNNLYRYEHPENYRSCYTLVKREGEICGLILDFMTHREYEKRFGY